MSEMDRDTLPIQSPAQRLLLPLVPGERIMLALWLYATLRGVERRGNWLGVAKRTCPFSGFAVG